MIDSHAHLTSDLVKEDPELLLKRARDVGISHIVNICTNPTELKAGLELAKEHPWIVNVGATTPHDVEKDGKTHFSAFEQAARKGELVAIGESGLDYHYTHSKKSIQKEYLKRYLALALELNLPIVIHCREAFDDLFDILDSDYSPQAKGVLHCFTGSVEEARELIKRNWWISLAGIVTFKKSLELQEVAKIIPTNQLLIETDTPFLAPTPMRGKPNEPAFLLHTAKFLAELTNVSLTSLLESTSQNAKEFFKLD